MCRCEAGDARAAALLALGRLAAEDNALLPHIRACLSDIHPAVRAAAISVLAPFAQHDEALHADLIALLQEDETSVCHTIELNVDWLLSYVAPLRSALFAQLTAHDRLKNPENMLKRIIVSRMLRILAPRDVETRQILIDIMMDGSSPLFNAAFDALLPLSLDDLDVRRAILPFLSDYSFSDLWLDEEVLGRLAAEDPAIRTILLSRLDHPDKASRRWLISTVSAFAADSDVRARLLLYLHDEDDEENTVCMAAASALVPLVPHDAEVRAALIACMPKLPGISLELVMRALAPLVPHDAEVRAALLAYLEHTDGYQRSTAVGGFGEVMAEDATLRPLLMDCLNDPEQHVRSAAISALAPRITTDPEARAAIVTHLTDSSEYVRARAVEALQPLVLSDAAMRAAAIAGLDDRHSDVREAAIGALLPYCEQDRELALRLLPALPWLKYYGTEELMRACLAGWLARDEGFRTRLIGLLGEHDWRLRAAAAQVLSIADLASVREARPALEAALDDWRGMEGLELQLEAAVMLLNTYHWSEQALAVVFQALNYRNDSVFAEFDKREVNELRSKAAQALGKLQAEYRRPDLLTYIEHLLRTEEDPDLLDGLFRSLSSLVAAPALGDKVTG